MKKFLSVIFTLLLSFSVSWSVLAQTVNNSNVDTKPVKLSQPENSVNDKVINKINEVLPKDGDRLFPQPELISEPVSNPTKNEVVAKDVKKPIPVITEILWQQKDWNTFVFLVSGILRVKNDKIRWDFGDGNSSNETAPEHTYKTSGNYKVSFVYTSPLGDEIKLDKQIDIPIFYLQNPRLWIFLGIVLGLTFLFLIIAMVIDYFRDKKIELESKDDLSELEEGAKIDDVVDNEEGQTEIEPEKEVEESDNIDWDDVEVLTYQDEDLKELDDKIAVAEGNEDEVDIAGDKKEQEEIVQDIQKDKVREVLEDEVMKAKKKKKSKKVIKKKVSKAKGKTKVKPVSKSVKARKKVAPRKTKKKKISN